MATLPPVIPAEQGLGGAPTMATPADQPQEQAPTVQGPAQPTVENPSQSVAQHIMSALGGGTGNPMDWAKGIVAGGLAGAANVGKQPEGAGWLHGAAQGAQGILEQRRQQALDLQKQQQVQQEQQLKQKADARAEQELQIHLEDTKVQRAMWNAQTAASIQNQQQNAERFPTLQKEDALKVKELSDKIHESEQDQLSVLSAAGVDISKLEHVTSSDQLTEDHAKQAGAGSIFAVPNGEKHDAGEDKAGAYIIPGSVWEQPITKPVTITTGYDVDPKTGKATPKTITAQEGTSVGTLLSIAKGAQQDLASKQKNIMDQANLAEKESATRAHNATTAHVQEETKLLKAGESGEGGPSTVDEIGTGRMIPERIGYLLGKKEGQQLMSQVAAKYPDIDMAKLQTYPEVAKQFASTKQGMAGGAINSGATAMQHLKNLQDLNTPMSHVPHTNAWTAYQNQLDTVAPELAKFYGDTTIPAIEAFKKTLGSTLPGNRDAAITTQVQSMGKKLDAYEQQWKNAIPSPKWTPTMPNMDEAAKEARASLDPQYKQRLVQEHGARQPGQPMYASAPGKPRLMSNDGGKTWQPAQ